MSKLFVAAPCHRRTGGSFSTQVVMVLMAVLATTPLRAAQTWTGATDATWQTATNWTTALPGTTETAIFDATSTQNLGITLSAAVTVKGLRISDPAGPLALAGSTLSLGTGGIDMSAATQNVTITSGVTLLSGDQSWTPATGRLLTVTNLPVRNGGANNNNIGGVLKVATTGSTIISNTARAVIADGGGNPFVAYGLNDWAATDATGLVIPATYTVDAFTGNANIVTPNTYAINGANVSSTRFDNSTGDVTVNNTNTSTLRGILVTSTALNVTISGGFIRPNRVSTAGATFSMIQNSTLGDTTINSNISNASSSAPVSITKSGVGRLVLGGASGYTGRTFVNEGTLQLGNGATGGSISSTVDIITQAGATFAVNRSDSVTVSNPISGAGQFTKLGSGSTTLSGSNSYTGPTNLNGGSLVFSNASNLGAGTAITFDSGTLAYASGNTVDVSGRTMTFNTNGAAVNTNGNNVSYAAAVGNAGAGGFTKAGAGRLTLAAGGGYTGNTTVAAGELRVNGPLSSPTLAVASGASLSGTGTLAGGVTVDSGAVLAPGNGAIGSLTLGSLTTSGGSSLIWEFNSTPANDLVVISTADGLTINGGTFSLFSEGTANPFGTVGTYNLLQYTGSVLGAGVGSLAVGNPAAGKSYTFGESGGYVTLTVATSGLVAQWNVDAGGNWTTASNWTPSEPNGAGDTATFGPVITAPRTVTLDADRTIGNMVFSSSNSYTVAATSSQSLTIGDGGSSKTIQVESGSHAITVPITLASNLSTDVLGGQRLTLSGPVSGAGSLTKTSAGTLHLTGSNTYTGETVAAGGAIEFTTGAISSSAITLGGGGLRYAAGNTEDISVKSVTFAAGGGTVDTNGNDVTLANVIGNYGAGGLTKAGAGTLTLAGANTYFGTTQINAGVVSIAADAALGLDPSASVVLNGGTLRTTAGFASSRAVTALAAGTIEVPGAADTLTLTGVATGAGLITKTGSGTLQFDGANTAFTGGVTLAGGTVTLGGGAANGFQGIGTGTIAFQNGAVLNLNGYANTPGATSYGNLANSLVVAAGQSGTMNLPGRCTISSAVTGSGTLGVNVQFIRGDFTGNWSAFAGSVIVGLTGTNTSGEFRLGGSQTTFGGAQVKLLAGTSLYQTFNPPSGTGTETVQPVGELSGDGTLAANPVAGRFTNWTVGGLNTSSTFAGRITDSGTAGAAKLTKAGSGTLTLTGTASTFTGATTINGGSLYVTSPNGEVGGLATTASITINNGGTLRSSANALFGWNANQGKDITVNTGGALTADNGADVHVGRVILNGGVLSSSGSSVEYGSWVFDGPATVLAVTESSTASAVNVRLQNGGSIDVAATKTLNFVGTITDSGSAGASNLIKAGTGTLTLAGINTYTGPTTVSAGTLMVNGVITGAGAVDVAAGAILAGTGTIAGDTTIQGGATIAPGASPGTLTLTGGLTWNESANYNWQMLSGTGAAGSLASWDLVNVTGTLAIAATSTSPFQLNLSTLSSIAPDVSGSAANFSSSQSYTWKIASATGGITGFAADKFVINTSATNGTGGFANTFTGGTFSLAQAGNDLNLVFTGAAPTVITISVASGTQTQTQAGYPTLSGSIPVFKTGAGMLVVDQANTLTGSTTVQQGVLRLANGSALSASRLAVIAGGTGQVAPYTSTSVAGVDLSGNGLMDVTSGALTIAGGLSTPQLVAELLEGRGDGSWNGISGITSSTAAADVASSIPRSVGWLDNGDGSMTVAYAAPGDTNIDWAIDILDASNFLALGKFDTGEAATWIEGDFSYDGIVDILDAADFFSTGLYDAGNYNTAPGATGGIAAVPEPALGIAGIAVLACAAMARRIRRQQDC